MTRGAFRLQIQPNVKFVFPLNSLIQQQQQKTIIDYALGSCFSVI